MSAAPTSTAARTAGLLEAIEAAYAAGMDRGRWPEFLTAAARLIEAVACQVMTRRADRSEWRIEQAVGVPDTIVDAYNGRWASRDPVMRGATARLGASPEVRVLRLGVAPEAETEVEDPFLTFFCHEAGVRHQLTAAGAEPGADAGGGDVALSFWRSHDKPFGAREMRAIRRLWPHFARARSLHTMTWEAPPPRTWLQGALDLWHIGIIGLSAAGRPLYANRAACRIAAAGDGLSLAADGPLGASPSVTKTLRAAIQQAAAAATEAPAGLRLRRLSGARSYEVALRPLRGAEPDAPALLMVVSDPEAPIELDTTALQHLHGLTAVEARVAASIAEGVSIQEIARVHRLSVNTARWYVQRVREKLEVERQQDVLRLIVRGVIGVTTSDLTKVAHKRPQS